MENEVIIEEKSVIQDNDPKYSKKTILSYAISGFAISLAVIVVAILYFVKVLDRSIAMHIMYPGIALNLLLNGLSMLKYGNKKVAKIDFIVCAIVFVAYIVMFILSLVS